MVLELGGQRVARHEPVAEHGDPGQRTPHGSWPDRFGDRHACQLSSLGLAVPVSDLDPGCLTERLEHLRIERLAGRYEPAHVRERWYVSALRDHSVFGGRHAED